MAVPLAGWRPGRAMVELAKASGTWTALDDVENLVEPPELATRSGRPELHPAVHQV